MPIYDSEEIKELITMDNVFSLLEYYGAEPEIYDDYIVAKTVCHDGDSRKLYFYENSKLFQCYTHCGSFDIIDFVRKMNPEMGFGEALNFLVSYFKLFTKIGLNIEKNTADLKYIKHWEELNQIQGNISSERLTPTPVDLTFLKHYPRPIIADWVKEGIAKEVCDFAGICYDPVQACIVIPHFNENGICVGIRQRTLLKEEEKWGKYRPYRYGTKLYNHPLSTTLYGLNWSKERISQLSTAIVVEAEKSVLSSMTAFGIKNNLCIGICGSSFSKYQFNLLWELGVNELVFALDKDFKEIGSDEYWQTVKKNMAICEKFSPYFHVSCMFDKYNYLGYKESPIEQGKEVFMQMFKERIFVEEWRQ